MKNNPKKLQSKVGPKPIYTSNPKDPRIQRYNDSMTMHKTHKGLIEKLKKETSPSKAAADGYSAYQKSADARKRLDNPKPERIAKKLIREKNPRFKESGGSLQSAEEYKKPVQPVVYKKADKSSEKLNYKKTLAKNTTKVAAAKSAIKAKPASKPVEKITMKPTTQEEANKLKAGFKKQTDKEFKSKDSDYNKLEKKLGRKPTVKEYNDSLKK